MKIFIDAGHGGDNPGATYNGRKESEDVYRLTESVKRLLEKQGVEVMTSRGAHEDPELSERCAKANEWGADYFLSIHRNAFEPNRAEGVEAWIYSRLSLNGVTANKADKIVSALSENVGFRNRGVRLGAPSYRDFAVNSMTNMDSCLLEVGFIDSINDNIRFDGFFDEICEGIARALIEANGGKWIVAGDVNGDGVANAVDSRLILRAAVGLENLTDEQIKNADMDGDGKITAADARKILRESVGLEG